jgi:diaminopimelate epimerase
MNIMELKVYKYQGAGNDFVIIDNRKNEYDLSEEQIKYLCDRRFGIGADGLMYLNHSNEYDFAMRYFNSDGKEGSMCGNGGRCLVAFAAHKGIKSYNFIASDGEHRARVLEYSPSLCKVELGIIDVTEVKELSPKSIFLNTGSPHLVIFVDKLSEYDVIGQGRLWRHHPKFPGGTNVNFVQGSWGKDSAAWGKSITPGSEQEISVRTFERGVEDETYACGTGVTASAIAYYHLLNKGNFRKLTGDEPVYISTNVKAVGGELNVSFRHNSGDYYSEVKLTGPAAFVFKCKIEL